jgi:hypothetical protein
MDDFEDIFAEYASQTDELINQCIESSKIQDLDFKELVVFLGFLHGLRLMHHAHHWQTSGPNFYGDHQMYQRMYEAIDAEIDTIAEKLVGMGDVKGTNYFVTLNTQKLFLEAASQGDKLEDESLRAELMLLIAGERIVQFYKEQGIMTSGLEQAIGNILDLHQTHAFLLQQRRG